MRIQTPMLSLLCAVSTLPGTLLARDAAAIRAPLHGTGDSAATGQVVAALGARQSDLIVQARGLLASHAYAVEIAGIVEGTMTSDRRGRAGIRFRAPIRGNVNALDFDPRGATLRILDGAGSVLEGVVSGRGEDAHCVISETAELEPGDDAPNRARGRVSFTAAASGRQTFRVDLSGLDDSPLHVFLDGIERGEIHRRGRMGTAVFSSQPPNDNFAFLDFDPRGSEVEVRTDDGGHVFSGRMQARIPHVNQAAPSMNVVALPATPAAGQGSASARLRIDERARKHFSVEVEDVPAAAYDLLVDGASVGTITVAASTGGTRGEIEFATGEDDPGEIPLTFDPLGKTLTIQQAATVFFQGLFNPNVSGTGAPAPESPSRTEESLTSTGLDADATARGRYRVDDKGRHKFSVEIEKVPAGMYQLIVAGVVRGTIVARLQPTTGAVLGEIEFATRQRLTAREAESGGSGGHGADDPAGDDHGGGANDDDAANGHERPLTFDPRGQTIEIQSASGLYFSHLFQAQ